MPRYLDDVQDELYAASSLHGDRAVEDDACRTVREINFTRSTAVPPHGELASAPRVISLNGPYRLASCFPGNLDAELDLLGRRAALEHSSGILDGWHRLGTDRSAWLEVTVPTTVQRALIEAGELADPLWDTNTIDELQNFGTPPKASWFFRKTRIEQQEWWFAREFEVPADWADGPLELDFDGIDYAATIYLNGQSLGYHAGMFGGPTLDVGRLIVTGATNLLVVRLHPAARHWYGLLKGSPGWGWHYGHLISTGIWRDVTLRQVPAVAAEHLFVHTIRIGEDGAELGVELDIVNRTGAVSEFVVHVSIDGPGDSSHVQATVLANPGTTRVRGSLRLPHPAVWWPVGYGDQPMYNAQALIDAGGTALASTSTAFGVRTVAMEGVPGLEGEGFYRWRFVINGRRLFIKGANWCWTDPYLHERLSPRIFELTRRSGVQMLRAWGGGIIESDEFYEACDRAGILVYQEFPLSFGPNDAPATDLGVIDRQSQRIVRRLRNHPSLVMWGGGNENETPLGADEVLFLIGRRCRQYDPSRPYHRTDPWGGSLHNYDVFHHGRPMDSGYANLPSVFYGEWGTPSAPRMANVLKYLPRSAVDHWPPTEADRGVIAHMHQFTILDFVKIARYANYGPINNWSTFIDYTQLAQADNHRFVAERQRSRPDTATGFWLYKMTELFPGASWGLIDFHGAPKRAYYTAAQFCRPEHAYAVYDRYDWPVRADFVAGIYLSNDRPQPLTAGRVVATLYDSTLEKIAREIYSHDELGPDSTAKLGELHQPVTDRMQPFFLSVDRVGSTEGGAWYWLNVKDKSDAVRKLDATYIRTFPADLVDVALSAYAQGSPSRLGNLPPAKIAVGARLISENAWEVVLANVGSVPALDLVLDDDGDGTLGYISDNYICLSPEQSRIVKLELGPGQSIETFSVTGWNVERVSLIPSAAL